MRKSLYLLLMSFLLGCSISPISSSKIEIESAYNVNQKIAQKIALTWLLASDVEFTEIRLWVGRNSDQNPGVCSWQKGKNIKFCSADYVINKDRHSDKCISELYPVIESCSEGNCTYEVGPEYGEIICW